MSDGGVLFRHEGVVPSPAATLESPGVAVVKLE
jgi:hypothetical protein